MSGESWNWQDQEWDAFCALIAESWPGDFTDEQAQVWRVMLDGIEPRKALEGLRACVYEGRAFRPSVSEVVAKINSDPSRPSFAEVMQLIYGPRGVLSAYPRPRSGGAITEGMVLEARRARLKEIHPLVASFVNRQGMDRLANLLINHPEHGGIVRRDLEREWDDHLAVTKDRNIATLASGEGENGLRRLDPLAAISTDRQLGVGNDS